MSHICLEERKTKKIVHFRRRRWRTQIKVDSVYGNEILVAVRYVRTSFQRHPRKDRGACDSFAMAVHIPWCSIFKTKDLSFSLTFASISRMAGNLIYTSLYSSSDGQNNTQSVNKQKPCSPERFQSAISKHRLFVRAAIFASFRRILDARNFGRMI